MKTTFLINEKLYRQEFDDILAWLENEYAVGQKLYISRRTINFEIFNKTEGIADYFSYKYSPYYDISSYGNSSKSCYKIWIHEEKDLAIPDFLKNAPNVKIIANDKDSRKNYEGNRLFIDNFILFYMYKSENIIIFNRESNKCAIFGTNVEDLYNDCRILIKDLANVSIINEGFVEVHASCVCDNDHNAIIVSGDKNSGKTTMLFRFMSDKLNLVSNGRVYMRECNGQLEIVGTPESIYVRPITVKNLPGFESFLQDVSEQDLHSKDCELSSKIKINFKQITAIFKVNIVPEALLHKIILPHLSVEHFDYRNTSENAFELGKHVFAYHQIKRREWLDVIKIDKKAYNSNATKILEVLNNYQNTFYFWLENEQFKSVKREQYV
jgi:hypothetical protein